MRFESPMLVVAGMEGLDKELRFAQDDLARSSRACKVCRTCRCRT